MTAVLSRFTIKRDGDQSVLRFRADDGDSIEVTATADQIESMSEAIQDQLALHDESDDSDDEDGDGEE